MIHPRRSFRRSVTSLAVATLMAGGTLLSTAAAPAQATTGPSVLAPTAACGYYSGNATTRRGDRGNRVKEIQCIINIWSGGHALDVDGIFGPRTESWVVYFQDRRGLRVDGIVGKQTWASLRAV